MYELFYVPVHLVLFVVGILLGFGVWKILREKGVHSDLAVFFTLAISRLFFFLLDTFVIDVIVSYLVQIPPPGP